MWGLFLLSTLIFIFCALYVVGMVRILLNMLGILGVIIICLIKRNLLYNNNKVIWIIYLSCLKLLNIQKNNVRFKNQTLKDQFPIQRSARISTCDPLRSIKNKISLHLPQKGRRGNQTYNNQQITNTLGNFVEVHSQKIQRRRIEVYTYP